MVRLLASGADQFARERVDGAEHVLGGAADQLGVAVRPPGDVTDRVVAGVDPEQSGDDVGDAFGLALFDATVGDVLAEVLIDVAEDDVPGFVQGGLGSLGGGEAGVDRDPVGYGVGVAVAVAGDLFQLDGPPFDPASLRGGLCRPRTRSLIRGPGRQRSFSGRE